MKRLNKRYFIQIILKGLNFYFFVMLPKLYFKIMFKSKLIFLSED